MKIKNSNLILLLILLLGLFLRVFPIKDLNYGSISYNSGLNIKNGGQFLISSDRTFGNEQAPIRYFFLHLFLRNNRSIFNIRLPALIFGILSIFLAYVLGKKMFNERTGLISAFLLSTSMWFIHHSTYNATYTLYSFSTLLFVLTWFEFNKNDSIKNLLLTLFSALFAFYSYYPFLIVFFVTFLFHFFNVKPKKRLNIIILGLFFLIFSSVGLILSYKGISNLSNDAPWGQKTNEIYTQVLSTFGGINFLPLNIFFFFFGFFISSKSKEKKSGLLLLLLVIIPILFFVLMFFLDFNIAARYLLNIYPLFVIICSFGLSKILNKYLLIIFLLVFNSAFIFYFLQEKDFTTSKYIPEDYLRHYANFEEISKFLINNYQKGDSVVVVQASGIFSIQYYLDTQNIFSVKEIYQTCRNRSYYKYDGLKIKDFFGLDLKENNPSKLIELLKYHKRLILIDLGHIKYNDRDNLIQTWIDDNFFSTYNDIKGASIYIFVNDNVSMNNHLCNNKTCYLDCGSEFKEFNYEFNI